MTYRFGTSSDRGFTGTKQRDLGYRLPEKNALVLIDAVPVVPSEIVVARISLVALPSHLVVICSTCKQFLFCVSAVYSN